LSCRKSCENRMVGIMIPINIEGGRRGSKQEKRIYNRDINKRRGSGVGPKPLLKKNSRPHLKTFQVKIKLDDDQDQTVGEQTKPPFDKRRSVQKIKLPTKDTVGELTKPKFVKKRSVQKLKLPSKDTVGDLTKPKLVKKRSVQKINLPTKDRKPGVVFSNGVKGQKVPIYLTVRRQSSTHDLLGLSQRRRSCGKTRKDSKSTLAKCQDSLSNISLDDNENFSPFQISALAAHNKYRDIHGATHLQLDIKLCKLAQCYADNLAASNKFEHSGDSMYGENLYWGWSSDSRWHLPGEEAVDSWYGEKKGYDYTREPCDPESGHFTQLVWSSTRRLGVAVTKSSKTGRYMVVMKYDPAGNYLDQYTDNVNQPNLEGGGKQQIL